MREALYRERADGKKVHCFLCPHNCIISDGNFGACWARKNEDGILYSLNYGMISSLALDPIEKKPLYHFKSGKRILSAGSFGCNFKCGFCQNWRIAHENPPVDFIPPEQLVESALALREKDNIGIAYTYNEPSIWYEYVLETSKLAKARGLDNVLVTNGYISREPLKELVQYVSAMNIDVKTFNKEASVKFCKGELQNVIETVEFCHDKCHIEITTLIVPGMNDKVEEIDELARWIANMNPEIPYHISRFFPNYKMDDIEPTPVEFMYRARDVAQKYLKNVYLGNVR